MLGRWWPTGLAVGDVTGYGPVVDGLAGLFIVFFARSIMENFKDLGIPLPTSAIKSLTVLEDKIGNGRTLIQREEAELIAAKATRVARLAQVQARIAIELARSDREKQAAKVGIARAVEDTKSAEGVLVEAKHQVDIHKIDAPDLLARQDVTTENGPLFVDDDVTPDTKPMPVVIVSSVDDVPLPVVVKNEEGL